MSRSINNKRIGDSIQILGVAVTSTDRKQLLEELAKQLSSPTVKPVTIVTPNPEQIIQANQNLKFKNLLNSASISLPDGIGLIWASKLLDKVNQVKRPLSERVSGVDMMTDLVELAQQKGNRVFLLGGTPGVGTFLAER